jgi:E217 collar protein gp28
MIPGSNTLSVALQVLGRTPVQYFQYVSRGTNAGGMLLTNYAASVEVNTGIVQAVDKKKYEELGLDWEKTYINWFVPALAAVDLARDVSGDVIETLGRRWQLVGSNDWLLIDGWKSVTAVDIGPATGTLTNA